MTNEVTLSPESRELITQLSAIDSSLTFANATQIDKKSCIRGLSKIRKLPATTLHFF